MFDGDVILFRPSFGDDYQSYEWYNGKPLIAEFDSPKISSDCKHWSSELKAAVEAGKTVFIFLTKPHDVYYHTGERTFLGHWQEPRNDTACCTYFLVRRYSATS